MQSVADRYKNQRRKKPNNIIPIIITGLIGIVIGVGANEFRWRRKIANIEQEMAAQVDTILKEGMVRFIDGIENGAKRE